MDSFGYLIDGRCEISITLCWIFKRQLIVASWRNINIIKGYHFGFFFRNRNRDRLHYERTISLMVVASEQSPYICAGIIEIRRIRSSSKIILYNTVMFVLRFFIVSNSVEMRIRGLFVLKCRCNNLSFALTDYMKIT